MKSVKTVNGISWSDETSKHVTLGFFTIVWHFIGKAIKGGKNHLFNEQQKLTGSCSVESLTLFILLFITAESDHRFLGLARFLRRHKTVIAVTGNRGLCLTCNKQRKMLFLRQNKNKFAQDPSKRNSAYWPLFVLVRPLVGRGVCMTVFSADSPRFWFSSSISGLSTFSSPRVWTAVSRFSNSSTWAWGKKQSAFSKSKDVKIPKRKTSCWN